MRINKNTIIYCVIIILGFVFFKFIFNHSEDYQKKEVNKLIENSAKQNAEIIFNVNVNKEFQNSLLAIEDDLTRLYPIQMTLCDVIKKYPNNQSDFIFKYYSEDVDLSTESTVLAQPITTITVNQKICKQIQ